MKININFIYNFIFYLYSNNISMTSKSIEKRPDKVEA